VVYGAGTAAEAVAALQAGALAIDVVLTDVRMPGAMDGFGLARWIRENHPEMPVLITTGDKALVAELCDRDAIIEKPHDFERVVARLRAAIDEAKSKVT